MTVVAIGCPARNRAWILPEYLAALKAIEHPEDDKWYVFLENDSTDGTLAFLEFWPYPWPRRVKTIRSPQPPGHGRNGGYGLNQYSHLAGIRNRFLEMALETDADYLLSVDSDVIVPPDILQHLLPLADERTIVGAAICNVAGRDLDGTQPGNFQVLQAGLLAHPPSYPLTGTMGVAMTGACVLIPRSLLEAGIRYGPHPQGEDGAFCSWARLAGYRIMVNFDVKPQHRMVESVAK